MVEEQEKILHKDETQDINVSFSKLCDNERIDNIFLQLGNLDITNIYTDCDLSSITPAPTSSQSLAEQSFLRFVQPLQSRLIDICIKYPLFGEPTKLQESLIDIKKRVDIYLKLQTWRCPHLIRYYGSHGFGIIYEFIDGPTLYELLKIQYTHDITNSNLSITLLGQHITIALLYLQHFGYSHNAITSHNLRFLTTKKLWKVCKVFI